MGAVFKLGYHYHYYYFIPSFKERLLVKLSWRKEENAVAVVAEFMTALVASA
jgi:hypothetical protein